MSIVDSDRTAVRSESALFVQAYLSKDLGSLWYSFKFNKQSGNELGYLYISKSFSSCDGLVNFPPWVLRGMYYGLCVSSFLLSCEVI